MAGAGPRGGPRDPDRSGRRRQSRIRRGDGRCRAQRAGPGRHPGQQRRHHPRHHLPPHERAAVAGGDQHQPQLLLQRHPPGDRWHARAQVGPHHPDQLDQRPEGPVRAGQLRGVQGRHARLHDLAGAGKRALRHHGQHRVARLHRHRHGHGGARGSAGQDRRQHPHRPPWHAGGDRLRRFVLHARRGRVDHRREPVGQRRALHGLGALAAPTRGAPAHRARQGRCAGSPFLPRKSGTHQHRIRSERVRRRRHRGDGELALSV